MSFSAERRTAASRRATPPAVLPNTDGVDGLPGVMDTADDLMSQLIEEAGAADEDAILETGLPDDYDPSGGMGELAGGGQVGRVFRLGTSEPAEQAPSSTSRSGLLPKFAAPRRPVAVAAKLSAPPAPPPGLLDDDAEDDAIDQDEDEDLGLDEDVVEQLGEGPEAEAPPPALADALPQDPVPEPATAASDDLDEALMAELAGGERSVGSVAAPPAPPAPEPERLSPAASWDELTDVAPPRTEPISPRVVWRGGILPVPHLRRDPEELTPSQEPGVAPWFCPLDTADGVAFDTVLHALGEDLLMHWTTLLPLYGDSERYRSLQALITRLATVPISTIGRIFYQKSGRRISFSVASRQYSYGQLTGMLLVTVTDEPGGVSIHDLFLFDPTLLIAS